MSRSRFWLVAVIAALLVFSVPVLTAGALSTPDPEVRLIRTGQTFSALIDTGDARLLLVNSVDRGVTRSAIGYLARPWEPRPTILLTAAGDRQAVGVWEAMRDPAVRQIVVAGLPGNDPVWSTIERESKERGITIEYLGAPAEIRSGEVIVTIFPGTDDVDGSISVQRGSVGLSIALGAGLPSGLAAQALVVNEILEDETPAELLIVPASVGTHADMDIVSAGERDIVRLVFGEDELRVRGGRLTLSAESAN